MKTTARTILSATTALGLSAFTLITVFTPGVSASIPATGFGLLVVYGLLEMMILSYAPRRPITRPANLRVVAPENATVFVPPSVEYPSCAQRACAA
jgi:hypothetical protein